MEGPPIKRRRVYSPEPNKTAAEAMFGRKYLNYLVPVLMKIKKKKSISNVEDYKEGGLCDIEKVLRYEVEMAMALSAQGFAWSNALKRKLQEEHHGIGMVLSSKSADETSKKVMNTKKCQNLTVTADSEDEDDHDDDNDDDEKQLRRLRRLIPGGEEMRNDQQMAAELKSYIRCLQMQVDILQCLAHTSTL